MIHFTLVGSPFDTGDRCFIGGEFKLTKEHYASVYSDLAAQMKTSW